MEHHAVFYRVLQESFELHVERADRFFGVALNGTITDGHGHFWANCNFGTHPEFAGYEEMQAMQTGSLVERAIAILSEGGHQQIAVVRGSGITIYFRMNGRNHA